MKTQSQQNERVVFFYMNEMGGWFTYIQSFVTFITLLFFYCKLHPDVSPLFFSLYTTWGTSFAGHNTIYYKRLGIGFSNKEKIYMTVKSLAY